MNKSRVILIIISILVLSSCTQTPPPTATTQIEFEILKAQASQITLSLADLPPGFAESHFESDRMVREENLFDVQSAFSFERETGNLQKIVGMVTIFPFAQRGYSAGIDEMDRQIELVTRSLVKGFVFTKSVDMEDFVLPQPVGDVYSGKTFKWSNADVGYPEYHTRSEFLVFERNNITVILLLQYIEELPVAISITEMAEILDRQIQDIG